MQIVMHSYTFRTYPLAEAFANAKRFGWDGIELQPCHFKRDAIDTELPAAIELGRRHGVPILCVDTGGDTISDDAAVREKAVLQIAHEIEVCGRCGITLMNGSVGSLRGPSKNYGDNGSALATPVHYERAAEAYRHLGALAAKVGITIVFEIHMFCLHDTIASTARLLDLIGLDNVKANPDTGNMFSTSTAEKDPAALDQLKGRIGYAHFKNCEKIGEVYNYSVKLADGHVDTAKWVAKLCEQGYDGPVCIEYCGAGDPHVAAAADVRYLRDTLDWIRRA